MVGMVLKMIFEGSDWVSLCIERKKKIWIGKGSFDG